MAELAADRSWRWFTVRLFGLSPQSRWWQSWQADETGPQRPSPSGAPAAQNDQPVKEANTAEEFDAWARAAGFRIKKPDAPEPAAEPYTPVRRDADGDPI